MSQTKQSAAAKEPLQLHGKKGQTEGQVFAAAALKPGHNAAFVMDAYQGNTVGDGADINGLIDGLKQTTKQVNEGDLSNLEAMLVGQATALQTIFTSLARRASHQQYQKHYESFLSLALKAQAQSRATISALVDLKYPRQSTFVKQANISNGPQQVNNGDTQNTGTQAGTHSQAEKPATLQSELLEDQRHGSTKLDTRATAKAARNHSAMEAVESVNRAAKRAR
jgi:hypothetical protein